MAGGAGGGGADGRGAARVALFPLPFQGHISPMLQLAGALRARGLAVTVLHTAFNAPDPARHPGLAFVAVPDAIPEAAGANGIAKILALNAAMEASGRVRVSHGGGSGGGAPAGVPGPRLHPPCRPEGRRRPRPAHTRAPHRR